MGLLGKQVWKILVPESDRGGFKFPLNKHLQWDAKVREISGGGMTIMSVARGEWSRPSADGEGMIVRETMIPVLLLTGKLEMDRIAHFTLGHYDQEAVLYYLVSEDVFMAEEKI